MVSRVSRLSSSSAAGRTALYLCEKNRTLGVLVAADVVRPESREAVEILHSQGMEVAMLTGDAWSVANAVAAELGIDRVFAQVLPESKSREIEQLQRAGQRVAMVGDGVNDAPALVTKLLVGSRGPNFVMRENVQRRIVVQSNLSGRDLRRVVNDIQERVAQNVRPQGYIGGAVLANGSVLEADAGAQRAWGGCSSDCRGKRYRASDGTGVFTRRLLLRMAIAGVTLP